MDETYERIIRELAIVYGQSRGVEVSAGKDGRSVEVLFHERVTLKPEVEQKSFRIVLHFDVQIGGELVSYPVIPPERVSIDAVSGYVPFHPNWQADGHYGGRLIRRDDKIRQTPMRYRYRAFLIEMIETQRDILRQECVFTNQEYIKNRNAWLWYQKRFLNGETV